MSGIVVSLCDLTGNMVRPWAEAGMEDGPRCDALFEARRFIDQAATILEKLPA